MSATTLQFVLAGLCFGTFPLLMNKSGLSGSLSSFSIIVIGIICVFPFAFSELKNIANINWKMALGAGIFDLISKTGV